MNWTVLRARLKAALARLYPGVYFDLEWIKESDHEWHDGGDPIIDRWHVVMQRKERERLRKAYRPLSAPAPLRAGGDDIPF